MSNNGPINPPGQISLPFIPTAPTAPVGGWYVFQTQYQSVPLPAPPVDVVIGVDYGAPKKINKDGCRCKKCKEYYPYAEANQEDGTLICYVCRKGL